MRVCHKINACFDDPNLVSTGGLVPTMALAQQARLAELAGEQLSVPGSAGANADLKIPALVAGMDAGADSIEDMGLLRHGGMGRLFAGLRAPTTLGTHLRAYAFGHVRQLDAVASRLLVGLAEYAPLLPGADRVAYLDIDDTIRGTYGYQKQGAGYGYNKVKGLNAQVAAVSTPVAAPVITATRLRRGSADSAHGAQRLIGDGLATARKAGVTGQITVRADSAYYQYPVVAAAQKGRARFSLTARMDAGITAAISRIPEHAWTGIRYPQAIWEDDGHGSGYWASDAEVAETTYTAFTSRKKADHVTARLIVRRVKRQGPKSVPTGQGEMFSVYRHHAVFTDSPLSMLAAEASHRDHAIIEQVIADLKAGPLAHAPSGVFTANTAPAVLAAMAFNLTRAAATLASAHHARARAASIRDQLINVPARIANRARQFWLHLPENWPWQTSWENLFHRLFPPGAVART